MPSFVLSTYDDLAAYRECHRCFWLKHKHRNFPPPHETISPFAETAKTAVLEYFDRYRGNVPAYFRGDVEGKLLDADDRIAVWRNSRKGLIALDQYGNATLRGWMDDCFVDEDKLHTPAFISFVHKESVKEDWTGRQMIYDAVIFLLNQNKCKTTDFAYQFFYFPDQILKTQGIGLTAKVIRIEADPSRAERLFNEAAELLRTRELPAADPYCQVCSWFTDRTRRLNP